MGTTVRLIIPMTGPRPASGPRGSLTGGAGGAPPSTQFQGAAEGMQLDPYLFPPPAAQFLFGTDLQPSVGAGTVTQLPGCSLNLSQGQVGVINAITILLDQVTISSNVVWTIFVNGAPVPNFNNLRVIPRSGAAAVSDQFTPVRLELPPGATLTMQALNKDGAPYNLGAQLFGWFWAAQRY